MAENKMCPHCGSQMFMAKIIRPGIIGVTVDPNDPYKILKENKDKFDIEIIGCARCKETVVEADLVTGVKCKECGRIVGPMDVSEEGICNVCVAVKQRTELANASREDLIKMLLDAEKKANPVATRMEKQIDKADNSVISAAACTTSTTVVTAESPDTEEEKPKARRKSRKKKDGEDEAVELDNAEEQDAVDEQGNESDTAETVDAINDLANQQTAPFPDIAMNPPEDEVTTTQVSSENVTVQQEEERPIGADFRMFDGEEPF